MKLRPLVLSCLLLLGSAGAQAPSEFQPPVQDASSAKAAGSAAGASARTAFAMKVDAIIAEAQAPGGASAHWGISVRRLDGTALFAHDDAALFRPASTAKLFTTAAALALLGPASTNATVVYYPTPIAGEIQGDLHLVGYDDPDLSAPQPPIEPATLSGAPAASTSALSEPDPLRGIASFVTDLQALGVRHINGSIIAGSVWDPYPQGWEQEDIPWGYGAPVSSVSVHDNQLRLVVTAGLHPGDLASASLIPETGFYHILSAVKTVSSAADATGVTLHHTPGDGTLRLTGSLAVHGSYATEVAIDDPALFVAAALRSALVAAGILVDGDATAPRDEPQDTHFLEETRRPLQLGLPLPAVAGSFPASGPPQRIVHTSPPLAADITGTLKESLNLHAELMLRRLGRLQGEGSTVGGARVVHQWLRNAGVAEHDFAFFDGSGLSTKDLVTPRATTQLLTFAAGQPWFPIWKDALPVGGVDGTLRSRFTTPALRGKVFAKTGTLGESRALAGFVRCKSGEELAFAILVDDHEPGSAADRVAMDKIVAAIAEAN